MKKKSAAAVALGKRSAKGRMKKLTPEQRSEIARKAAKAWWAKAKAEAPAAASAKVRSAKARKRAAKGA